MRLLRFHDERIPVPRWLARTVLALNVVAVLVAVLVGIRAISTGSVALAVAAVVVALVCVNASVTFRSETD